MNNESINKSDHIGEYVSFVFKDRNGNLTTVTQKIEIEEDLDTGNLKFFVKRFIDKKPENAISRANNFIRNEQNKPTSPSDLAKRRKRPEDISSEITYPNGDKVILVPKR